ncbi:MAG: hypothetical protein DMG96_30675, partial [Acidobacteria bacterium]
WMIRSYAVTTLFLTARVVLAVPIVQRLGAGASAQVLWTLLVLSLIFTEFGLAWRSIVGRRPASRVVAAS